MLSGLWTLSIQSAQCDRFFSTRSSSSVDTSDTNHRGLSRLFNYGVNQDSKSSCYRGMPASKEAWHPVTTSLSWDRQPEARIVCLTLCQSPSTDQSPWLSGLLDSRYGSPAGHCWRQRYCATLHSFTALHLTALVHVPFLLHICCPCRYGA